MLHYLDMSKPEMAQVLHLVPRFGYGYGFPGHWILWLEGEERVTWRNEMRRGVSPPTPDLGTLRLEIAKPHY